MKAESVENQTIGKDQKELIFSRKYRPLIKLLASQSVQLTNQTKQQSVASQTDAIQRTNELEAAPKKVVKIIEPVKKKP